MSLVNDTASWYFSYRHAETMMVNASVYGIPEESDYLWSAKEKAEEEEAGERTYRDEDLCWKVPLKLSELLTNSLDN
jgi:hypothetical protein